MASKNELGPITTNLFNLHYNLSLRLGDTLEKKSWNWGLAAALEKK